MYELSFLQSKFIASYKGPKTASLIAIDTTDISNYTYIHVFDDILQALVYDDHHKKICADIFE